MHPDDKREQRERYLRAMAKHHRTHEEERRVRSEARARRSERRERGRRRDPELDEDDEAFEKIRRREGAGKPRAGAAAAIPDSPLDLPDDAVVGRVAGVHRNRLRVLLDGVDPGGGTPRELDVAPGGTHAPPVVGDVVWVSREGRGPRLVRLEPRRSFLARASAAEGRASLLAANVDLGLIVASVRRPDLRPGLVARVRLALEAGEVTPIVCLNKVDLVSPAELSALRASLAPWGLEDLETWLLSAETGEGVDELRERLEGTTSVLVGHSGVGKSSLLNALLPGLERPTAEGRAFDGKGRHTTTSSALVELGPDTFVVDTPGVRAFGLAGVGREAVDEAFPEVAELARSCRFGDCRHAAEPDCAVRRAAEAGALAPETLAAWRGLLEASG